MFIKSQGLGKWVWPKIWVVLGRTHAKKTHRVLNPVGFLALGFSHAKKNKWKPTKQLDTMPYWTS